MNYLYKYFILFDASQIFLVIISLFIFSCNQEQFAKSNNKFKNFPSKKIFDAQIIEKDAGKKIYYLKATSIEEYGFLQTPIIIFPKGIFIEFYNYKNNQKSSLIANYAKVIELKKYYEVKGNIVIITPQRDTIKTQSFFYLRDKKKFLTKDTVKIIHSNNSIIYANHGLEACDDFSCYKLFNNKKSKIIIQNNTRH